MKNLFALILMFAASLLFAQNQTPSDTSYWRKGGFGSATFSQVSLTNWAAGGDNSVAVNGNLSLFANRVKGRGKWENSLDIAYGLVRQADQNFRKSNDLLNFVTSYNYQISQEEKKIFYTALFDFRTQFYEGFDEEGVFISDFMAPGYAIVSLGLSYIPNDKLSFTLQPITDKWTFVNNQTLADSGAYGVDPGSNFRSELGNFFRVKYKNEIFESRLELFTNYKEGLGSTDFNWQNALVLPVTKVLTANVFTQLIYDNDILIENDDNGNGAIEDSEITARVQFKSVLGIGLTYNFGAKPPAN